MLLNLLAINSVLLLDEELNVVPKIPFKLPKNQLLK